MLEEIDKYEESILAILRSFKIIVIKKKDLARRTMEIFEIRKGSVIKTKLQEQEID